MYFLWLLVSLGLMAAPVGKCPLTVLDLQDSYCPNSPVVSLRIKNPATEPIEVSLMVDKRTKSGEWERFVTDMFADSAYPLPKTVVTLGSHAELAVQWRPPKWMTREPLGAGSYRIVALVGLGGRTRQHPCYLAQFVVTRAACR
jgi:hypothetical protein